MEITHCSIEVPVSSTDRNQLVSSIQVVLEGHPVIWVLGDINDDGTYTLQLAGKYGAVTIAYASVINRL